MREFHKTLVTLICLCAYAHSALAQPQAAPVAAPQAEVRTLSNVSVTMRDGVTLSLDVYLPSPPGRYPTLYAAGPYPHAGDGSPPDSPETGPVAWLVNQGYNYVLASVRGTGASTGSFGFLGREEQQDHYEVIEWIAAQAWSNGQVAGIGADYYGTTQLHMAIQGPPHLLCVAPFNAVAAPYQDWVAPGGVASRAVLDWYEGRVREPHASPARGAPHYIELDLKLEQLRHPLLDAYWQVRSPSRYFNQIRIPVFLLGNWRAGSPGQQQMLKSLPALPASARAAFGYHPELLHDRELLESELLPFYNWCFSGQDPGGSHALRPRIQVAVRNQQELRNLSDWPAAAVRFTPLALGHPAEEEGALDLEPVPGGSAASELGGDDGMNSVTFRSPVLGQDLELVGPLLLELYASTTGTDTAFGVEVFEELTTLKVPGSPAALPTFLNPEASPELDLLSATSGVLVSSGQLKASARTLSGSLGADMQPDYAFNAPASVAAGSVYRYDIALQPIAWRFKAGSRIVLKLAQISDAALRMRPRRDMLYHNAQYPSRLQLPLLPDPGIPQTAPFAPFTATSPDLAPPPTPPDPEPQPNNADALFDNTNPVIVLPHD